MSQTKAASQGEKYEPSRMLSSFHIKGFQHWDGVLVLSNMKVGDKLDLVPEFNNPFDPQAIAVYFNDSKLGYVPADENETFAVMFFYGYKDAFEARVMQIDPEADPWNQVRMGIYVTDAR